MRIHHDAEAGARDRRAADDGPAAPANDWRDGGRVDGAAAARPRTPFPFGCAVAVLACAGLVVGYFLPWLAGWRQEREFANERARVEHLRTLKGDASGPRE